MTKRGRPRGTGGPTHWSRNPANVAAHYASLLMELWLADAPMTEVRTLLWPFWRSPDHQAIIEECWNRRGTSRRRTVPPKIKRKLGELAIAYVMELQRLREDAGPQIEASLQRSGSEAKAELRDRGWTDEKIAAWFNKLSERARKRTRKVFRTPNLDKVLKIATRRAPAGTLRRKSRRHGDDRENAYLQYDEHTRNAWRDG
jgi:hypothetical protein